MARPLLVPFLLLILAALIMPLPFFLDLEWYYEAGLFLIGCFLVNTFINAVLKVAGKR